jgi:hypothetical protein
MAYSRNSASFDFDANDPGPGGFYHSAGDDQGNTMIGWGRRRTKWVQLSQAEIASFLASAHSMVRTDNPAVKGALEKLAQALTADQPLTFDRLSELAQADPGIGPRFAEIMAGKAAGNPQRALELMRDELAEAGKL